MLTDHRIAFGSCNNANMPSIWDEVQKTKPSSLLLMGDNVYVDKIKERFANPTQLFQAAYGKLASDTSWSRLVNSIGGYSNLWATYDDHDYGRNNADKVY